MFGPLMQTVSVIGNPPPWARKPNPRPRVQGDGSEMSADIELPRAFYEWAFRNYGLSRRALDFKRNVNTSDFMAYVQAWRSEGRRSNPFSPLEAVAGGIVGGMAYDAVRALSGRRRRRNPRRSREGIRAAWDLARRHAPWMSGNGFRRALALAVENPGEPINLGSFGEVEFIRDSQHAVTVSFMDRVGRTSTFETVTIPVDEVKGLLEQLGGPGPRAGNPRRKNYAPANDHDLPARRVPVPPLKLPRSLVKGTLTLDEAIRRHPQIKKDIDAYRRFHGPNVEISDEIVILDDGRPGIESGFLIGRTPEVTYTDVPMGSNKQGAPWGHETRKSKPTYLAYSPQTRMTRVFGGMKVSDWLRGN